MMRAQEPMSEDNGPKISVPPHHPLYSLSTQLEEAEARLSFVIALTDGIIFELDADGRYLEIWTRSPELLAVPREVALGRTLAEVFGPQAAEPFMERLRRTLETGRADRFEFSLNVATGLRWFGAEAMRVPNRQTVVFLLRDITGDKLLEQRLVQADRLAAMGTLAAGVAHEVNNPLSYISSNINFISEGVEGLRYPLKGPLGQADIAHMLETVDECLEALSEAQEGTARILRMASNLKTFARGNDKVQGRANVRQALEASLAISMRELSHRARVIKELEEVPEVDGSETRLEQVFLNLLINAAQAIPEGAPDKNRVEVHLFKKEGQVLVEIRDTGAGMPSEMLARIFDPFFTTRRVGSGVGLGLSISHGIIASMGGEISVESAVGQGTCFRVRLPALRENQGAGPSSPTERARLS
jgi:two-component system NtrC family sensor kinase